MGSGMYPKSSEKCCLMKVEQVCSSFLSQIFGILDHFSKFLQSTSKFKIPKKPRFIWGTQPVTKSLTKIMFVSLLLGMA